MSTSNFEAITFTAYPEQTADFTADARVNDREMQAEEPFRSRIYHAGNFHVPQDMLDQVEQECAALPESVSLTFHTGKQYWASDSHWLSPFLKGFLEASETRFREFVQASTGAAHKDLICAVQAGPYRFREDNDWHRDSSDPYGRQYLATLFGPTTEFSLDTYTTAQFDSGDLVHVGGVDLRSIYPSPHHHITLHAEGTTVHRAPPESYTNVNRLFYHCLFAKRANYK